MPSLISKARRSRSISQYATESYRDNEAAKNKLTVELQVQAGGSFDIDYVVTGPNDKIILDGEKERQGDFVFTANEMGEYKFCFNNEMSTYSDKFVDFEIAVRLLNCDSFRTYKQIADRM